MHLIVAHGEMVGNAVGGGGSVINVGDNLELVTIMGVGLTLAGGGSNPGIQEQPHFLVTGS